MKRTQLENIILFTGLSGAIALLFMVFFNQQQLNTFFPEKGRYLTKRFRLVQALDDLSLELTRIQLYCLKQGPSSKPEPGILPPGPLLEALAKKIAELSVLDPKVRSGYPSLGNAIHELSGKLRALNEDSASGKASLSTQSCFKLAQNTNRLVGKQKEVLWHTIEISGTFALEQAKRNFATRTAILVASLMLFALSFLIAARYKKQRDKAEADLHTVNNELTLSIENERTLRESKQALVSVVSHDLRTPLCALQHTMEMLTDNVYGSLPQPAQEKVVLAEKNIERLVSLINKLLDIERRNASHAAITLENVDLVNIISESLELVSGLAEHSSIFFEVKAAPTLSIKGDKQALEQVLVNLLSNAIKYSPSRSKIFINALVTDGIVEVRIQDNGPGIELSMQTKIFEKFQQGEKSPYSALASNGLGLAICKDIIENHGGTIGVLSEPGSGCTFWFKLPSTSI